MNKMSFFTEDLWVIILARLPILTITTSKLVCKQWKSIVESPFFRQKFLSHHQNSHSSWSLMSADPPEEVVAHYGCQVWGLPRSLGSYVSSFVAAITESKKKTNGLWSWGPMLRVASYTDIGLILLYVATSSDDKTYYVANPISKQGIKIPTPPTSLEFVGFETEDPWFKEIITFKELFEISNDAGLVTRTGDGVVLWFKVVLVETRHKNTKSVLAFNIYSSETGSWSSRIVQSPLPLISVNHLDPVSLNGTLHWLGFDLDHQDVLVYYDLCGSDNYCRVLPFPDSDKQPKFKRSFTTSGGNLMYMNTYSEEKDNGTVEHKLSVWGLKNDQWKIVSEVTGFDYLPLAINPFDGNTLYMWSEMQNSLASINLRNRNLELHSELERSRDGQTLSSVQCNREMDTMECLSDSYFSMFALPRWLYRIPIPPSHADTSL